MTPAVVTCGQSCAVGLADILAQYGMALERVAPDAPIPGSYWGEAEAGLVGDTLFVRDDTPLHSALHEACHYICMDQTRRSQLHTDAGGEFEEENGVCYLQILLAAQFPGIGQQQMMRDMDSWGYTFRLGSTQAWFERDADDARIWLLDHHLIDAVGRPTWQKRI